MSEGVATTTHYIIIIPTLACTLGVLLLTLLSKTPSFGYPCSFLLVCKLWGSTVAEVNQTTRARLRLVYWRTAVNLCTGQVNCERWLVDHPRASWPTPGPCVWGGVRYRWWVPDGWSTPHRGLIPGRYNKILLQLLNFLSETRVALPGIDAAQMSSVVLYKLEKSEHFNHYTILL